MPRRKRDYVHVSEYASLDHLIEKLVAIRSGLPQDHEAEIRITGDQFFGRKLSVSFLRDLADDELVEAGLHKQHCGQET